MASRTRTLLLLALGLTLTACGTGGALTSGASSSPSSPSVPPSPTPRVTAGTRATPGPSPSALTYPANVMHLPHFSPLETETYFVEPDATDIQVFYSIPAEGWISWFGAGKMGQGTNPADAGLGLSIINVRNVVADGCTDHAAAYPPVGPTVDDMAAALATLKPFELIMPPTAVTAWGFSGKYLELAVPDLAFEVRDDGNVFSDCANGELWSWIGPPLSFAYHGYSYPGQVEEIWLLDVDGQRLMIDAGRSPGSSDADIAELSSILDSIDIVP